MIYGVLFIVNLSAIWILVMTRVLIVHRILLWNHILAPKSRVCVRRLKLLYCRRMSILLLLIVRRLIGWSRIRHLHRWDSWYLTSWLVGVHTSWAPHLAYLQWYLLGIGMHHSFCGALTWWKHRWSTFGMSWRDSLLVTLCGAMVVCVLHWDWHGHFGLSFCLGLWFDTVAALEKELVVVLFNQLLRHFFGLGIVISVDLLDRHQVILNVFEVLALELFGLLQ